MQTIQVHLDVKAAFSPETQHIYRRKEILNQKNKVSSRNECIQLKLKTIIGV